VKLHSAQQSPQKNLTKHSLLLINTYKKDIYKFSTSTIPKEKRSPYEDGLDKADLDLNIEFSY